MFSDSPITATGFKFSPDTKRLKDEAGCQTVTEVTDDKEIQTVPSYESSSQTDVRFGLSDPPPYDVQKLASFLHGVYSELIEELDKSDFNSMLTKYEEDTCDNTVTNLQTIETAGDVVSSVCWNSKGDLAVSFCKPVHESWCTHDGLVYLYTTNENDQVMTLPEHVLCTSSCPKVLTFHPSIPSLLAGGLYDGQLLVWRLNNKNDPLIKFDQDLGVNFIRHSNSITCLTWVNGGKFLVSCGKDGCVLFWSIIYGVVHICKRFLIPSKYSNRENVSWSDHSEILSCDFSPDDNSTDFVVAIEGGNVLLCSYNRAGTTELIPGFFDPVAMNYESNSSIVTCIRFLTTDKFATCGTDSKIHVYILNKKNPVLVINTSFPLFGFERLGNKLIACWGLSSNIHFYNFNSKIKEGLDSFTAKLDSIDTQITTVKFNNVRKGVLATGTENGKINIWIISNLP